MPNWIPITVDNLNDTKVSALVDACREAALAENQTDPSPRIIQSVVTRIRAEVQGCAKNQVDADVTTIPADLLDLACRMIVRQLQSRLKIALTEDEQMEQRNDLRYLERIAKCEVPVAVPDNAAPVPEVQATSGTPRITPKRRRVTPCTQEGL